MARLCASRCFLREDIKGDGALCRLVTKCHSLLQAGPREQANSYQQCGTNVIALWQAPGHSKSHDAVSKIGRVPLARGRTKQPCRIEPRPAAIYAHTFPSAIRARISYSFFVGVAVGWRGGVALGVTVLSPLPDVPDHVVKLKGVCWLLPHRVCPPARIIFVPRVTGSLVVIISPPELGRGSRPGGVFPLRFAGQPVRSFTWAPPHLAIQPCNIGLRVIPAHADHRITLALRETRSLPAQTWVFVPFKAVTAAAVTGGMICLTHECRVLAARDIVFPNRKGRHSHFVLRSLVRDSVKTSTVAGSPGFLVAWRTHNELPGCKNDHFRALRAVAKDRTRLASRSLLSRNCRL